MDEDLNNSDFLNEVDITSKIRAPGEYKYYYIGENNSESDKSFLVVSPMWHSKKPIENMKLITSTYNSRYTTQLFSDKKLNLYKIYVYKNIIDYKNENMSLKLAHIIQITPINKAQYTSNSERENENKPINIRMFLAANNYIILNEVDYRIILIDITTGKFSTLFLRIPDERSSLYNVFDTFDESYVTNGEIKIRTYVFISIKNLERKTATYFCRYFIVEKGTLEEKILDLHSINFDLGTAEPLGLKASRIRHKFIINGEETVKSFFILCYISADKLFQLVTDYDTINFHKKIQRVGPYIRSAILKKENSGINENNSNNNDNTVVNIGKFKVWFCLSRIELVKNQICQNIKISLNLSTKKLCAFILYFETKNVVSYFFNYFDKPEEIKNKIFRNSAENIKIEAMKFEANFPTIAKIYKFLDYSLFKDSCFFGFSNKNLIIGENNIIHIYDEESELPVYTYQFFEENLSSLIILPELGSIFLLTENKLFKIIYNSRYKIFSNDKIFKEENHIHLYKSKKININEKINFPIFEFKPEDIWNSYRRALGITPEKFTECIVQNPDSDEEEILIYKPKVKNTSNNYWDNIMNDNQNNAKEDNNTKNNIDKRNCVICGKECKLCCNDCKMRYYCSKEHFKYDYVSYHFFECQLFQFFKRGDIMNSKFPQVRYKILYNEFIKTCGRILSFIFKRIITNKDYLDYLEMLLTLIQIMDNFGFYENLKEFCNTCLCASSNDKKKFESEKIIFYQEAIFFYLQVNLMKCTFALRSGLYNLADCYIKIIKNDMITKLTQRYNKRMPLLKCGQNIIYKNKYFQDFNFPLFFDLKKYVKFLGKYNYFDIIEEYISKQLMNLSILTKFKLKLNSKIEVQNTFVSINILFDDHFGENYSYRNIILYAFFSTTFYMVEIGKITQTAKLLKRILNNLDFDTLLFSLVSFNLGLLQYSLGRFELGVHNMEIAYKLMNEKQFSEKLILRTIDSLGLAYLNQKNLFKAYILFRTSIDLRKQLNKQKSNINCNSINVYLNYIIDLYEYNFISKTRFLVKKKYKNYDKHQLLKFVLGEMDEEVISEQNLSQLIDTVEFIYKLPPNVLTQLNIDNPPKAASGIREDFHHEKNFSFNSDLSQTSTFIYKESGRDNDEYSDEYEEDIEVKTNVYDYLFSRQQQQEFKKLKTMYFKREIILRDSLGEIEKFNINFDPVYAFEFLKIIEKLKSDFLLKEIFYCFQNEKWRDELYNYNQNNILFGLSKYLKLEKIKNMIQIEKSKNKEKKYAKNSIKNSISVANKNYLSDSEDEENKKDFENVTKNEEIQLIISNKNEDSAQNNKNVKYNYPIFKKKFLEALKEIEKDKKNEDLYEFLTFDEAYLVNLYKNVYINNPDGNFILKNPLLILNYVYIDVDKTSMFEKKNLNAYLKLTESSDKNLSKINSSGVFSKRESIDSKDSKSSVTFSNGFRKSKSKSKNSKNVSMTSNIESNSENSVDKKEKSNSKSDDENQSPSASSGTSSSSEKSAKYSFFDYEDGTIKIISKEAEYMYLCLKKRKTEKHFADINTKKTPKTMHEFALSFYAKDDKNSNLRRSKRTFIDEIDNYVNSSKNHEVSKKENSIENEKTFTVIQKNNLLESIKKKEKSKSKSKKKSTKKKQKNTKKKKRNLENILSTINKKNKTNHVHVSKKEEENMYDELFKQLKEKDNNNNNLKNNYSPENKNKTRNDYNFKSKEAKERELEKGAINYLKNNMDKKLFANIGMDIERKNENLKNKKQNTINKKKNINSTSITTSNEVLPTTKEMEMNSGYIDDYIYSKNFKKDIKKMMGKKENKDNKNTIEKKNNKTINSNKYKGENTLTKEKYNIPDNSFCSCSCGGGQECAYHNKNGKKPKKYTCNFKICPKNNKNNY